MLLDRVQVLLHCHHAWRKIELTTQRLLRMFDRQRWFGSRCSRHLCFGSWIEQPSIISSWKDWAKPTRQVLENVLGWAVECLVCFLKGVQSFSLIGRDQKAKPTLWTSSNSHKTNIFYILNQIIWLFVWLKARWFFCSWLHAWCTDQGGSRPVYNCDGYIHVECQHLHNAISGKGN